MKSGRWTPKDKRLLKQLIEDKVDMQTMMLELNRIEPSVRKMLQQLGYQAKTIWIKD
jgi:predicted transcriptional regulator